jgi:hypothetical protein
LKKATNLFAADGLLPRSGFSDKPSGRALPVAD